MGAGIQNNRFAVNCLKSSMISLSYFTRSMICWLNVDCCCMVTGESAGHIADSPEVSQIFSSTLCQHRLHRSPIETTLQGPNNPPRETCWVHHPPPGLVVPESFSTLRKRRLIGVVPASASRFFVPATRRSALGGAGRGAGPGHRRLAAG